MNGKKRVNRMWSKVLVFLLICSQLISCLGILGNGNTGNKVYAAENQSNIALASNGTIASSSGNETNSFGHEKAIDGDVTSRWSSSVGVGAKWLQLEYTSIATMNRVVIEWERRNATKYKVELSLDGTNWTTVQSFSTAPALKRQEIVFAEEQRAKYIRIYIEAFSASLDMPSGSWENVSIYEVETYGTLQPIENINIARSATASAISVEVASFSPDKVIDGVVNRKKDGGLGNSRWASAVENGDKWIQLEFADLVNMKAFVIEWERPNVENYKLQISENGTNWVDIATYTTAPDEVRQEINLSQVKSGKYVRIYITKYDGSFWNNVSIFEFEVYSYDLLTPVVAPTPAVVAKALTAPAITADSTQLPLPQVPEGYQIEYVGADYEQVISPDRTIHKPIVDTKVMVSFRVSKDGVSATSPDFEITIPGTHVVIEGNNEKPTVIPELREWYGTTGDFTISETSRIVVRTADYSKLKDTADIFAADYKDIIGQQITVVMADAPNAGDFFLNLASTDAGLGEEGYYVTITDKVEIDAVNVTGAFWATRSVLQILKQTKTTIPQGITRDYPRYEVRSFMYDVARKPVSLDSIIDVMKTMSWYKMNDFQLHLNDNYIFLENYADPADALANGYSGFRIESDIVGENGISLTSQDLYYTKEEFNQFIKLSKNYGITIVPEFDVPAHSLAIVKAFPELQILAKDSPKTGKAANRNSEMLDLSNPETLELIKRIWSEYLDGGDNKIFDTDVVHVGADEFYGSSSSYRTFVNNILTYIRDEKDVTPRIWGSLTMKSGIEPVTAHGVQMDIWSQGWANADQMRDLGYDLINIMDGSVYIVPDAGYYADYLNGSYLYNSWQVNNFGDIVLSPTDPQVIGGSFALWNDMIDAHANGLTEQDLFDRIYPAIQVITEKLWGRAQDKTYAEHQALAGKVGFAPNSNPYSIVDSIGKTVIDYDFNQDNIQDASGNNYNALGKTNASLSLGKIDQGIKLSGGVSYVTLPVEDIGQNYTMSMWVNRSTTSDDSEQILLESDGGQFKAVQKGTGKMGFSREGYDYSFDYTLPKDEWVKLRLEGTKGVTKLYVNDIYVDEISKAHTSITKLGITKPQSGTFVLPLNRIGSMTAAFDGTIDNFKVDFSSTVVTMVNVIPHSEMTATATSQTSPALGNDGPAAYAIDDSKETMWHSNYNKTANPLPQSITLTFNKPYIVKQLYYLPRQGADNGIITEYEIQVKNGSEEFKSVTTGTWSADKSLKAATFTPQEVTEIKLIAKGAVNGFVSAAEINVGQGILVEKELDYTLLDVALVAANTITDTSVYTTASLTIFQIAKQDALNLYGNSLATQEQINAKAEALNQAVSKLVVVSQPIIIYNISFDINGGTTITPNPIQVNKESAIGLMPETPEKNGYQFIGWNTKKDGTGETVTSATVPTNNMTVYANWKAKDIPVEKPSDSGNAGGSGSSSGTNATLETVSGEITVQPDASWSNVESLLKKALVGTEITVEIKNGDRIPADILKAVKGKDIDIILDRKDFAWKFNGKNVNNIPDEKDIDLNVSIIKAVSIKNLTQAQAVSSKQQIMQFEIANKGKLPFKGFLKVKLDAKYANKKVYLSYYDEIAKRIDYKNSAVADSIGYVSFEFEDAYKCILTMTQPSSASVITSKTMYIKKPYTLKFKNDIKGSKKTFSSSNNAIVSISKSGKIIAKKSGRAIVTTILYVDGVKYTYTTTLIVKK